METVIRNTVMKSSWPLPENNTNTSGTTTPMVGDGDMEQTNALPESPLAVTTSSFLSFLRKNQNKTHESRIENFFSRKQKFACGSNAKNHYDPFIQPATKCGWSRCHNKWFKDFFTFALHCCHHTEECPFMCQVEGCNKSYNTEKKLIVHTRNHTGERPFQCPIGECGKRFLRIEDIQKHKKKCHLIKSYICYKCTREYTNSTWLRKHLARVHGVKDHENRDDKLLNKDGTVVMTPIEVLIPPIVPTANVVPRVVPVKVLTPPILPLPNAVPRVVPLTVLTSPIVPVANLVPRVVPVKVLSPPHVPVVEKPIFVPAHYPVSRVPFPSSAFQSHIPRKLQSHPWHSNLMNVGQRPNTIFQLIQT